MKDKIKVCDKCKGTNIKTLVPRIKEVCPKAEIQIGCQNFCGIGRIKPFLIFNHKPLIAETEDELIEKLRETIQ